jgi:Domain of unknown function (DUF4403)
MRKLAILLAAVLGAAGVWFFAGGPASIDADPPPPAPESAGIAEAPESVILFRAEMPLAGLEAAINAEAPASQSGVEFDPVPDPVKNDKAEWTVSRSEIAVSGRDGALDLATALSGAVEISGTVKLLVKLKLKAGGAVSGLATAVLRPALGADWRVRPNLAAAVDISRAEVALDGVGSVSVRGVIGKALEKLIAGLAPKLEARLARDDFLERQAAKLWKDLCGAHAFEVDGEKARLVLVPRSFLASQPAIGADKITLALGLKAQARIDQADGAAPAACPELAPLEIVAAPPEGGFSLAVPLVLSWELVSKLASEELAKADGPDGAAIESIVFSPHGERVLAKIAFSAKSTSWFGAAALGGTAYATAMPVFDPASATVRFEDVQLTSETGAALAGRSAIAAFIIARTGAPEIAFGKLLAKARRKADKALETLKAGAAGVDLSGVAIETLEPGSLAVRRDGLEILAIAKGSANAAVITLDLAP